MTEDGQQTELGALEDARDLAIEAVKLAKELEEQRTVLRPQLERRRRILTAKLDPIQEQLIQVNRALNQIEAGEPTDYRWRKPRKAKGARAGAEGE